MEVRGEARFSKEGTKFRVSGVSGQDRKNLIPMQMQLSTISTNLSIGSYTYPVSCWSDRGVDHTAVYCSSVLHSFFLFGRAILVADHFIRLAEAPG